MPEPSAWADQANRGTPWFLPFRRSSRPILTHGSGSSITIGATIPSEIGQAAPSQDSSNNPSRRHASNRRRDFDTVAGTQPILAAIYLPAVTPISDGPIHVVATARDLTKAHGLPLHHSVLSRSQDHAAAHKTRNRSREHAVPS